MGGVDFEDEDVLEYDSGTGSWSMAYDGSASHADLSGGADLDAAAAVPEPGQLLLLVSGAALLLLLKRSYRR